MRLLVLAVVAATLVVTPSATATDDWWFKTPDGAAYCGVDKTGWLCMRPSDGFWLRLTHVFGANPDVRKGYDDRFRHNRRPAPRVLGFGRVFYSSDAEVITCWSRRTGVTCKHYLGLSFSLGRRSGHRIFYDAPGSPPNVRPLFRSTHGIYCGINEDNLEPSSPLLTCWRPLDGLVVGIGHPGNGRRGAHRRDEQALDFRPRGFGLLGEESTFVWRCRRVTSFLAERCSERDGEPVFTCASSRARLTCENRNGHGFRTSARSFYTF